MTECLDIHRTHRHADRDTVVRVARQQGHYDRAVMAKWLPDERLMTVRSSLQPRSLDKAIARLDPDSRASFDLEVEVLAKAQEADDREARDRQKRYLNSRLRHKAEARAQTDIACPMHHCEGTLYTKGRREEEPAGWQIDLLGPSSERTVSAACDTCTWYGGWSGDMSTEPHWSYKAPVHPRLTRFMTRYPHGPATVRQRRSMTELQEALYKEHRLCQEVRKHVGIRVPRPAHPEETRFETFAKRYRVTETKRCPACGKKALQAKPVVLRHGNPITPATDVDMDREVRCLSCGHVFWD